MFHLTSFGKHFRLKKCNTFYFVFRKIGAVSNVWCEKFQDKLEPNKQWVDICQEEFSQVTFFS